MVPESLILFALGTELFSWRFQLNPPFDLPRTLALTRDHLVNGLRAVRRGEPPRLGSSDLRWALQNTGDFFVLPLHYNPEPRGLMHLAGAPFRVVQILPEPVTADGRHMEPGTFFNHDLAHAILGFRNMQNEIGRGEVPVDAYFKRENDLARAIEERLERVADDDLRRVLRATLVTAFQDNGLSVRAVVAGAGSRGIVIPEEQGGPRNSRLERRARQWLRANVASLAGE